MMFQDPNAARKSISIVKRPTPRPNVAIGFENLKTGPLNLLFGGEESGWVILSGRDQTAAAIQIDQYYQTVPWLFRGVNIRASHVTEVPFVLQNKSGTEIDSSEDWQNVCGFLPDPTSLFWLIEASLTLTGRAYLWRTHPTQIATGYTKGLRYLSPHSVTPILKPEEGLQGFKRTIEQKIVEVSIDDIVYFWQLDPKVELGPPVNFPARAAAMAAGVLASIDEFATAFFERGAIEATIFQAKNMPQTERDRFLSWWRKFVTGKRNAFTTEIVNSDEMQAVKVGQGLESLENVTLTDDKKKEIAAALGIPVGIVFEEEANRATAEQSKLNLLTGTIIPECKFIADILNHQIFEPMGYKLVFQWEEMHEFQVDEKERGVALKDLVTALTTPEEADIAMSILGYGLDDETQTKFDDLVKSAKEKRLKPPPPPPQLPANVPGQPMDQKPPPADNMPQQPPAVPIRALKDLSIWMRKCVRAVGSGKPAHLTAFTSDTIPAGIFDTISTALVDCKTVENVHDLFDQYTGEAEPEEVGSTRLAIAIEEATRMLKESV